MTTPAQPSIRPSSDTSLMPILHAVPRGLIAGLCTGVIFALVMDAIGVPAVALARAGTEKILGAAVILTSTIIIGAMIGGAAGRVALEILKKISENKLFTHSSGGAIGAVVAIISTICLTKMINPFFSVEAITFLIFMGAIGAAVTASIPMDIEENSEHIVKIFDQTQRVEQIKNQNIS